MITTQKLAELKVYCMQIKELARESGLRPDDIQYLSVKRKTDLIEALIEFAQASIVLYLNRDVEFTGWEALIFKYIAGGDLDEDTGI